MDISELEDPHHRPDFRRASGAPMVIVDGKNQRFARPSGFGKDLDDENALVNWKLTRAIIGVAKDPAIQARAQAAKDDDRATWTDIREDAIQAGRGAEAADIGTALHAMSERWEDPDDDFDPGPPYREHLQAYSAELERLGLTSVYTECHMVNTEYRAAGTADRIYRATRSLVTPHGEIVEPGTMLIGDLKTGKKLDFSKAGYSVQMALYAASQLYDVANDEFVETPDINQQWGVLIHMPSDDPRCEALWVDLEVGRWGAYLVSEVRKWRRNWRSGEFDLGQIAAIPDSLAEMVARDDPPETPEQWFEMMMPWAKDRLAAIKEHGEAFVYTKRFWPKDVPTPKQGIATPDDLTGLLDFLDDVERRFSLPFIPKPGLGSDHKSTIPRGNTPPTTEKE